MWWRRRYGQRGRGWGADTVVPALSHSPVLCKHYQANIMVAGVMVVVVSSMNSTIYQMLFYSKHGQHFVCKRRTTKC